LWPSLRNKRRSFRFETVVARSADLHSRRTLENAFHRMIADAVTAIRDVTIGESAEHFRVQMDLAVCSKRQAMRRGEELFAFAWYDAFGERRAPSHGSVREEA
jgi:hypothetical protein